MKEKKAVYAVAGYRNPPLLSGRMRKEKSHGVRTYVLMKTLVIPRRHTIAIEIRAGCPANISAPKPITVVEKERKIDLL